ncbi:uncharacterized protein LOC106664169 [Cimex lectularius]|uniref:Immunoglobulin domain-containing protein n=1 Tax=Cimex lectularius TaxID=79782 RepID=A0A8I6RGW2_CIMLE|nr:uncharacterized protein LOC106664169 [Cimex lectularius]
MGHAAPRQTDMKGIIVLVIILVHTHGLLCLRDVMLKIPRAVKAGSTLHIFCYYDLEGVQLYSVKFYQGDQEFYRYVPKEAPPTRVFPLPYVQVDIYESNSTVVTLNNVQKELSGLYKCEVSADAPLFHTVIQSTHLVVVEEPRGAPDIRVEKQKYTLGERIRANCTSKASFPAANLSFFINDIKVANNDLIGLSWYVKSEPAGLESSLLQLHTLAVPMMFPEGRMQLACLAAQYTLYKQMSYLTLYEDTPQLAHVLGASLPHDRPGIKSTASIKREPVVLLSIVVATLLRPR